MTNNEFTKLTNISDSTIVDLINHIKSRLNILDHTDLTYRKADISEDEEGEQTSFTYIVEDQNNKFFLKVGVDGIKKIAYSTNYIRKYHPELEVDGKLVLPLIIDNFNGILYEFLPLSKGNSFTKLFEKYCNDEITNEYLQNCYFNLGQTLSEVYSAGAVNNGVITKISKLKTKLIHGDLNPNNIFCSPEGVTLIDNNGFAYSTHYPTTIKKDLKIIIIDIATNLMCRDLLDPVMPITENMKDMREAVASFINGYSSNLESNIKFDYAPLYMNIIDNVNKTYEYELNSGTCQHILDDVRFKILGKVASALDADDYSQ